MANLRIAINGFGRIGRLLFRILHDQPGVEVVAVNDLTDNATLAHLLQYDTAHGQWKQSIHADESTLIINGRSVYAFSEADPRQLPWKSHHIDIVVECTGRFRSVEKASYHLEAGAKKVLISAPASGNIKTIVLGVNDHQMHADDQILSNASCTTNCLAPIVKVLYEAFGIEYGFATTVHAYTADQNLQDAPHSDLRRARAAAMNIVPTSTNAGTALDQVMPEMKGKIKASAVRVPVVDGSMTELTALLSKHPSAEDIHQAFLKASLHHLNGILAYTEAPLVSSDIIGNPSSAIYDSGLTMVQQNMVKITAWYDNEFGYASRLKDVLLKWMRMN